jgi:predicted component of type VI protein secretion system
MGRVKTKTGSTKSGLEQFSELLSRQNEGLNKQERESRLLALERIARSVSG